MTRDEFFKKIEGRFSEEDLKKIYWAYWLAKQTHRNQKRDGGERYFEHCRAVANILVDRGSSNVEEIITALLHDCVEDCFISYDLLRQLFGDKIVGALKILSKIEIVLDMPGVVQEKNRKNDEDYFKAIAGADEFIRRVKLADRLHNLCDMKKEWPRERQQKYIIETERYILPIAAQTDEWFTKELENEVNYFSEPFEHRGLCIKCKKEVAQFKVWIKNKFLESFDKEQNKLFSCPVENMHEVREKLAKQDWKGAWAVLKTPMKKADNFFGGVFRTSTSHDSCHTFCGTGNHFFCKECARTEIDSDGWSIDVYMYCPLHE